MPALYASGWAQFLDRVCRQVHVRTRQAADRDETHVQIDHRLPNRNDRQRRRQARWLITTIPPRRPLSLAQYGAGAAEVNRVADDPHGSVVRPARRRGRAIYCFDLKRNKLPVAAVAVHIDERAHVPVQITAIARLRSAEEEQESLLGTALLQLHVLCVGRKLERGEGVIAEENVFHDAAERDALGFVRAGRIRDLRPASPLYRLELE